MKSTASLSVGADQAAIQSAIAVSELPWPSVQPNAWRSVMDVAIDWTTICAAAWEAFRIGGWAIPLAIILIGNRQRALGNLLHDAGHKNLSVSRKVNDRTACIFLAPALFNSLVVYRREHAKHHAWLGEPARDPDFIPRLASMSDRWLHAYLRSLANPTAWVGSLLGHLPSKCLSTRETLSIFVWWGIYESALGVFVGVRFALLFFSLWMVAKGTVFHAITTFREMTDHYGLKPPGIFRYTRDVPDHGLVSMLLHPHHNGYHLTHHLLPHVPYYHLPTVHRLLRQIPFFERQAIVCEAYLNSSPSAVDGWEAHNG
ncbi:fatty acid desaturase [Burkholderia cenocepacia]|uniref:fatty acid desaturase family protein n=1 Tax=Burkholderia cenocepacia TaxID=95486 RepID=UPI00285AB923|nr:fatty acid desaturase [Burkholderia cenocepacia]MDR8105036.1 fatty acid desaturase [Burkholderia cenocepacia]